MSDDSDKPAVVSRLSVQKRGFLQERQIRVGLVIALLLVFFALLGPSFAPHSHEALVGQTYGEPSVKAWLGYDYLGRDVWSRVLSGGQSIIWMSVAASVIALVIGTSLGVAAGYLRHGFDRAVVWLTDVILAFPDLILVLLVVSMLGRDPWLIVLTVSIAFIPGVIRLSRGVTLGVAEQEFVEAARMMGYSRRRILVREILPNILTPLVIQFGIMLTWAVGILAGLSFLGYGVAPPAADWGLMINENTPGLMIQPWAVIAPIVLIALFALSTNLIAEGMTRVNAQTEGQ